MLLEFAKEKTSGERKTVVTWKSTPAEVVAVLDIEVVDMEFEMEHKKFAMEDMGFAIVRRAFEKECTGFETAGKGSEGKPAASGSTGKGFVGEGTQTGQLVGESEVGHIAAEKKGNFLEVVAGKLDALGDGVVVVVSPAVDIYSAVEIGGTPAYIGAGVVAAADNSLDCGP